MEIRSMGEQAYFAASNSEQGFFSYYGACFDAPRVTRLFAVKGGPGTGKSRFLREVAQTAKRCGWACEYIYCSSDPDSLDGVILTGLHECIALLDATAPHTYEPRFPGVREELVDLGKFWDRTKLVQNREEILRLCRQKQDAYGRAYRYLCAEGSMRKTYVKLAAPFLHREKIVTFAEKQLKNLPAGDGYEETIALIRSVGMRGDVIFDSYYAAAENCVLLEDCYGSGELFLEAVRDLAQKRGWKIKLSFDPVIPTRPDGIFLSEYRQAFLLLPKKPESWKGRSLSLRRFVDVCGMREIKGELHFLARMRSCMHQGALAALRTVRDAHFSLENDYISAMDFEAKEKYTKKFCKTLFDLQNED